MFWSQVHPNLAWFKHSESGKGRTDQGTSLVGRTASENKKNGSGLSSFFRTLFFVQYPILYTILHYLNAWLKPTPHSTKIGNNVPTWGPMLYVMSEAVVPGSDPIAMAVLASGSG